NAFFLDPPRQASRTTTSASQPGFKNPLFSRYTRALLPVAAAIAHSTGISERLARYVIMYNMPSGMIPLPVGVSVAIRKRSNWFALRQRSPIISVVRRLPRSEEHTSELQSPDQLVCS